MIDPDFSRELARLAQRARELRGRLAGWLSAREALNRWVDKQHFVLPPTWSQLREIARFETVAELLAEPREISMIMPDATTATMSGLRFPHSDKYFVELDGRLPSDASR